MKVYVCPRHNSSSCIVLVCNCPTFELTGTQWQDAAAGPVERGVRPQFRPHARAFAPDATEQATGAQSIPEGPRRVPLQRQ
ncbi:MAG TPA: hypothetical protein PLP93_06790 [Nitrosomonas sp.]|nr:hypothetical protein [Nitrosomonas sp.]HRB45396.1 hypothetical protein [Nitrosomonas sp.]HRB77465.1 hypothetical protein [Nitrosomonas sp.]